MHFPLPTADGRSGYPVTRRMRSSNYVVAEMHNPAQMLRIAGPLALAASIPFVRTAYMAVILTQEVA